MKKFILISKKILEDNIFYDMWMLSSLGALMLAFYLFGLVFNPKNVLLYSILYSVFPIVFYGHYVKYFIRDYKYELKEQINKLNKEGE